MQSVLHIEDDELFVAFLGRLLAINGFDVRNVNNGEDALELLKTYTPDLIVMDGMLPGISGFETLRRLKESPALTDIPVIMLTAQGNEDDIVKALSGGAFDYAVKPIKTKEFILRVIRAIRMTNAEVNSRPASAHELEPDSVR